MNKQNVVVQISWVGQSTKSKRKSEHHDILFRKDTTDYVPLSEWYRDLSLTVNSFESDFLDVKCSENSERYHDLLSVNYCRHQRLTGTCLKVTDLCKVKDASVQHTCDTHCNSLEEPTFESELTWQVCKNSDWLLPILKNCQWQLCTWQHDFITFIIKT